MDCLRNPGNRGRNDHHGSGSGNPLHTTNHRGSRSMAAYGKLTIRGHCILGRRYFAAVCKKITNRLVHGLQISSITLAGFLVGIATGIVGLGQVAALSPQVATIIRQDAWWIVVLSMLVPLADYLSGVRTTLLGVVARHPFRHLAGFFAGVSVGLGLFLLLSPRLVSTLPSQL
jgi:hypothetical protein